MVGTISHNRKEESIEAKARWFQSLSVEERMELLCQFTDMIISANPKIMEQKDAQPIKGRVFVVEFAGIGTNKGGVTKWEKRNWSPGR